MAEERQGIWSVRELAEKARTSVRTVHYYMAEGLLPPPIGAKRGALYSAAHLARLRLIAALRDEGLALAAIRQRLAPLSDGQVLAVAADLEAHLARGDLGGLTTLGLIEAVVATQTSGDGSDTTDAVSGPHLAVFHSLATAEPAPRMHAAARHAAADAPGGSGSASDYVKQLLRRPRSAPAPASSPPRVVPLPTPKPKGPAERPEAWYHFAVEDGVELRVREDRYHAAGGRLRAVVDTVRDSLRRYGLSPPEKPDDRS
jgi:DNA-binding transcriptional MerR regulator